MKKGYLEKFWNGERMQEEEEEDGRELQAHGSRK